MQVLESTVSPRSDGFRANADTMAAHISAFREVEQKVLDLAEAARDKFTKRGKLLPRDRINRLLDRGTPFLELCSLAGYMMHDDKDGSMAGGGIIAGIGYVSGTRCLVVASNSAIKGGTITPAGLDKTLRLQQIAMENKLPVVLCRNNNGVPAWSQSWINCAALADPAGVIGPLLPMKPQGWPSMAPWPQTVAAQ